MVHSRHPREPSTSRLGIFLIKDKIEEWEVEIRYCPTEKMWSDVLNEPKQGGPLRKYQAMLMGVPEEYNDNVEYCRTHQELLPSNK